MCLNLALEIVSIETHTPFAMCVDWVLENATPKPGVGKNNIQST